MTKDKLIARVTELELDNAQLNSQIDSLNMEEATMVRISQWDYNNYERIRTDQQELIKQCSLLQSSNNDLVQTVAQLSKGMPEVILKLSERL